MTWLLIGIVVVAIVAVIALAVANPFMRKKEDAAIAVVKTSLGPDAISIIEPRTTAMGTEPESAGGVRGMCCLAVSKTELLAVTWSGLNEWRVPRSSITGVTTAAEDPAAGHKAMVTVSYPSAAGEATAMFRLREPAPWLTELGYDWGPDGPPAAEIDDDED